MAWRNVLYIWVGAGRKSLYIRRRWNHINQSIRRALLCHLLLWTPPVNINMVSQPIFWGSSCCLLFWSVSSPRSCCWPTLTTPLMSAPSCPLLPARLQQPKVSDTATLLFSETQGMPYRLQKLVVPSLTSSLIANFNASGLIKFCSFERMRTWVLSFPLGKNHIWAMKNSLDNSR